MSSLRQFCQGISRSWHQTSRRMGFVRHALANIDLQYKRLILHDTVFSAEKYRYSVQSIGRNSGDPSYYPACQEPRPRRSQSIYRPFQLMPMHRILARKLAVWSPGLRFERPVRFRFNGSVLQTVLCLRLAIVCSSFRLHWKSTPSLVPLPSEPEKDKINAHPDGHTHANPNLCSGGKAGGWKRGVR